MVMFDWVANFNFDGFYLISQIFALAATIISLYAFQRRKKIQILNYSVVEAILGAFHFLFLGAWSGMVTKIVGATRNAFAAYETHKHKTSKIVPWVFVLFYVVSGIIAYKSPVSLLPIVSATIYTLAIYYLDAKKLRYVAVLTSGMWLIYGVCIFSIMEIIADSVYIVNDLIAIYRFRKKPARKRGASRSK